MISYFRKTICLQKGNFCGIEPRLEGSKTPSLTGVARVARAADLPSRVMASRHSQPLPNQMPLGLMDRTMNVMEMFRLDGKKALVTGGSSGIGKRVALAYAQAGAKVAIVSRRSEVLSKVAQELSTTCGARVIAVPADVTQSADVNRMVEAVVSEFGGIDIAVCNAGIVTLSGLAEMSLEEFSGIQNTNVNGVFLTAQACARAMIKQGRGGVIINTASMSGHVINVPQKEGHYCASKAAVIHLTKAMAVEFAPYHIRVNSVSPGYILTELVEPLTEYHQVWVPKIPLGRLGRPEELMGLYLYLASSASSYMTGTDIVIDGGYTCL